MTTLSLSEKVCTKCGEAKPLSEFWKDKNRKDGRVHSCKRCARPLVDASIQRRKARIGEDEFRRLGRKSVARARLLGTADPRPVQARNAAVNELVRRHPEEVSALVRVERYKLGLNPDPNRASA